jgi:hypothetical protein
MQSLSAISMNTLNYCIRKGGKSINWEMLNRVDYSRPHVIKNALRSYNELMMLARKGDQVAHIICIDIKTAIHAPGVLSFKQRRYLGLWWQGFNTIEIATMDSVSHVAVIRMIARAMRNISENLTKKVTKHPVESISNWEGVI